MNKLDWYRDRILWKASQHKIFCKNPSCILGENLSYSQKNIIDQYRKHDNDIIFIFWKDKSQWTVIDAEFLYSKYNLTLEIINLDSIGKKVSLSKQNYIGYQEAKFNSEYIYLDALDKYIWAPAGKNIFALMNILLMFPLKS